MVEPTVKRKRGRPSKAEPKLAPEKAKSVSTTDEAAMPAADEEKDEMLDFLCSHISDEVSFSSYSCKQMPSRLL